jgi:hypothetical protein
METSSNENRVASSTTLGSVGVTVIPLLPFASTAATHEGAESNPKIAIRKTIGLNAFLRQPGAYALWQSSLAMIESPLTSQLLREKSTDAGSATLNPKANPLEQ